MNPLNNSPHQILQPDPFLKMDELSHRYSYKGTYLDGSISQIVNPMTAEQRSWMERKYPEAAPRGTAIHRALEIFLTTGQTSQEIFHGEESDDLLPYRDWIDPLLAHHLWDTHDPIASELKVVDLDSSIAGCMDAVLINTDKSSPLFGSLLLLDLKTKSKPDSRPQNASKQLGGYINLLRTTSPDHADFADQIKQVAILCNRPAPGPTTLHFYDPAIAEALYLDAKQGYLKNKPRYSF